MNNKGILASFLGMLGVAGAKQEIHIETNPEAVELEIARVKREALQRAKFPSRKQRLRLGLPFPLQSPVIKPVNYRSLYRKMAKINAKATGLK